MASYSVVVKPSAARELDDIGQRKDRERVLERLLNLAEDPRPFGVEKLANEDNTYRIRQGSYRILYEIDDHARRVRVMKIADRKDAYRR